MLKSILVGLVSLNLFTGTNVHSEKNPEQKITMEHGYMVVKDENPNDSKSTIVARVTNDVDFLGYVEAVNLFDKNDTVSIVNMGLHTGEIVLITFDNDEVVKVQENHLDFLGGK